MIERVHLPANDAIVELCYPAQWPLLFIVHTHLIIEKLWLSIFDEVKHVTMLDQSS